MNIDLVTPEERASVRLLPEATEPHSRLLRCSLCVDESRAYWSHVDPANARTSAEKAFAESWFGTKSEAWTTELLSNMRVRFDAFPEALAVLAAWRRMTFETRRLICHVHLQLTDPLYRSFTGEFLVERRDSMRATVSRQAVVDWVVEHGPPRWALKTQVQFASRLLTCALSAGLVGGKREPREAIVPTVPDDALAYTLYLLRSVELRGSLVRNPYLTSLGLLGSSLSDRIRSLSSVELRQMGDVIDLEWKYPSLASWARAEIGIGGDA